MENFTFMSNSVEPKVLQSGPAVWRVVMRHFQKHHHLSCKSMHWNRGSLLLTEWVIF